MGSELLKRVRLSGPRARASCHHRHWPGGAQFRVPTVACDLACRRLARTDLCLHVGVILGFLGILLGDAL